MLQIRDRPSRLANLPATLRLSVCLEQHLTCFLCSPLRKGHIIKTIKCSKKNAEFEPASTGLETVCQQDIYPARPSAPLPLPAVLAKLQNDPRRLLGWELRLLRSPAQTGNAAQGRPGRRRSAPSSSTPGQSAEGCVANNGDIGSQRLSLGQVVEVLNAAVPRQMDAASEGDLEQGPAGKSKAHVRHRSPAAIPIAIAKGGSAAMPASYADDPQPDNRRASAGPPGAAQVMLRSVRSAAIPQYEFDGNEEFFVRLDAEVLPYADIASRVLLVEPPAGLLERGRRSLLLQLLRRELVQLGATVSSIRRQAPDGGSAAAATATAGSPASAAEGVASGQQQQQPKREEEVEEGPPTRPHGAPVAAGVMPTRRRLMEAGRPDLVELVAEAGGFSEVALTLGLRCARRPRGYWSGADSWQRLGEELAAFVAAGWVELPHPDNPDRTYFFNQVSQRTTWRRPQPLRRLPSGARQRGEAPAATATEGGNAGDARGRGGVSGSGGSGDGGVRWVVAEAAADRVMPSQALVLRAGRTDLHNAVMYHGGYLQVAAQLGRRVTWARNKRLYDSPAAVRRELAAVAKELQLPPGELPTSRDLSQSGHAALLAAVRRHPELRELLGIRRRRSAARRPRGRWDDLPALARELADFAAAKKRPAAASTATAPAPGAGAEASGGRGALGGGGCEGDGGSSAAVRSCGVAREAVGPDDGGDGEADAVHGDKDSRRRHQELGPEGAERGALSVAAPPRRRGRPREQQQPLEQPPYSQPSRGLDTHLTESHGSRPASATERGPDALRTELGTGQAEQMGPGQRARMWMPTLRELHAAGRHDLAYGISARHAGRLRELASLAGLQLRTDRRGRNRHALSFQIVSAAIQAGCRTPKAIREHMEQQAGVTVTRQHLTAYLARMADTGRLEKLAFGQYGLPAGGKG